MVVTRFAPSPTGDLHVGSARTALYCWLYARKMGGKFILRIEDTDRERSTDAAVDIILEGMRWLGLDWDEGPIYQTQRFDRYQELVDKLLVEGKAYRCYCSKERLTQLRDDQMAAKQKPRYDGHCRDQKGDDSSKPHVIRFKNPQEGSVVFEDTVMGRIEVGNQELDDLIIVRTDGAPTYNFTVVVDDSDMGITHVMRGTDHINNTPRQINLLHALGSPIPVYGHMPMLLGEDGKKLSKRHGAASVLEDRDRGLLPQALINYLVRLGWSHGDQEIFSIEELIEKFDIHDVNRAPSAYNPQKLLWLNQHYLKTLPVDRVALDLCKHYSDAGLDLSQGPSLDRVIPIYAQRCHTLVEMVESTKYLYEDFSEYDETAKKKLFNQKSLEPMTHVYNQLVALKDWTKENINDIIRSISEELGLGLGKIMQPMRLAVTGGTVSPSLDDTLELLGKDKTIARLEKAVSVIESSKEA